MSDDWNTVRVRLARERAASAIERAAAAAERAAEVHSEAAIAHERHARIAAELLQTMERLQTMESVRGYSGHAQKLRSIAERERDRADLEQVMADRERAIADRLAPGAVTPLVPRGEASHVGGAEAARALPDG
jgi:hypothetical protein